MTDEIRYKNAGVDETFDIDWSDIIVETWRRDTEYAIGAIVRPPVGNGFFYVANAAGRSSDLVPHFVPGDTETTKDGSVVWTANVSSSPDLDDIVSHVFALDTGISEVSKSITGLVTRITISGGDAGEQYRVTETITRESGAEAVNSWILEIVELADV